MFLEELKQVTCNSLDICTDPELFIDFSEHTFLCYGSKYGSYSVITSSGPITAKIIERPRDFSISLDNGTILTFLALCESNQECPISTSNDSQISTSNDSQISTSNDSQIYIALSVIIIIVVITVTTTVLLALILARYKCRRKNFIRPYDNSTKLKQTTNHQSAIKQNSSDIALTEIEITDSCADNHFNNTVTAYTVQSSHRTSIPDHLIFSAASIQLTDSIGQGEFGIVYKGYIINSRQIIMDIVAIKTLKGFQDHSTVEKLLIECTKMKDLNHPNVLTLIGVCLDGGPAPFIITPFMENGSLLSYLRKKRSILLPREVNVKPVLKQLMDMCLQVAKGMEYLASMKIVHRDLAARNCMMDINSVIKVADFGLAETLGNKDYFRQDKTIIIKLPLRWLAPESLEDHIFSEKSDVWAYGVTCWEIFSGGKVLYPGVNESELLWLFKSGQRLDKPENCACSDHMYSFMSQCWELEPQKRPPFSELVQSLSVTLETMAEYVPLCKETSKESEV